MARKTTHRFDETKGAAFRGKLINRTKPLEFMLDGIPYKGFEGDTVLSAIMGAGINTVGKKNGEAIALTSEFCPPVVEKSTIGKPQAAISMHRMPAKDGMDLLLADFSGKNTSSGKFKRMFSGNASTSLNYKLEQHVNFSSLYGQVAIEEKKKFDLVIVGAGVAGMSAARTATDMGWRVALVEQKPELGGDAIFFGAIEGERRPEYYIQDLSHDITDDDRLFIYLNAKAYFINNESVRIHQILKGNPDVHTKILELQAKYIILATGLLERLPLFCGNRLPGVKRAREAFDLAVNYGLWQGNRSAFSTSSSPAIQVAMLASEMGVKIQKLADSRTNPKSRFLEFSKAYGISLATGSQVNYCKMQKNDELLVQFGMVAEYEKEVGGPLIVNSLIVCGGWQPNLDMWLMAGGKIRWNEQSQQLLKSTELENTKLAGACMGAQSMSECAASGQKAVWMLQGKSIHESRYFTKNTDHESDDGKLQVSKEIPKMPTRFLDGGSSFLCSQKTEIKQLWKKNFSEKQKIHADMARKNTKHSLGDLAAKIILQEISGKHAGLLSQERCNVYEILDASTTIEYDENTRSKIKTHKIPDYLMARFGEHAEIRKIELSEIQNLEVGCLIYSNRENKGPKHAIGAIIDMEPSPGGNIIAYLNTKRADAFPRIEINNGSFYSSATICKN